MAGSRDRYWYAYGIAIITEFSDRLHHAAAVDRVPGWFRDMYTEYFHTEEGTLLYGRSE